MSDIQRYYVKGFDLNRWSDKLQKSDSGTYCLYKDVEPVIKELKGKIKELTEWRTITGNILKDDMYLGEKVLVKSQHDQVFIKVIGKYKWKDYTNYKWLPIPK